jgi:hypothetical protein
VVYEIDLTIALADTLDAFAYPPSPSSSSPSSSSSSTTIIIAQQDHNPDAERVLLREMTERGFEWSFVESSDLHPHFQAKDTWVRKFKRRKLVHS